MTPLIELKLSQPRATSAGGQADRVDKSRSPRVVVVLAVLIVGLLIYRVAYHAAYITENPFALVSLSDGAVYEAAARDILGEPPLGTAAFALQGFYAYFMAAAMSGVAWIGMVLLAQVVLGGGTLFVFYRSVRMLWGRTAGMMCLAVLLAYPALAFYENKFVTAELGIACNVAALWSYCRICTARRTGSRGLWLLVLGVSSGFCILARPNMVLALPFTAVALWVQAKHTTGQRGGGAIFGRASWMLIAGVGVVMALAPMAVRNHEVTGDFEVTRGSGGGTSFFVGNNPQARGVWSSAGVVSGRVGTELSELADGLGVVEASERERARAVGTALYRRAFTWIIENPADWLALEFKKLWLIAGNAEITQDYDWFGEQEIIPWAHGIGVPFASLLGLALLGWAALRPSNLVYDGSAVVVSRSGGLSATKWFLLGQIVAPLAANLLFFTSAQHRLPLVIPLTVLAGPGLFFLGSAWKTKSRRSLAVVALAVAVTAQGAWPRLRKQTPHAVHYYNLAIAQDQSGSPAAALTTLDHAIELRPNSYHFLLRRSDLRARFLDLAGAEDDARQVMGMAEIPAWAHEGAHARAKLLRAQRDQASIGRAPSEER